MPRLSLFALSLGAILAVATGCKKSDSGAGQGQPIPPDDPSNSPIGGGAKGPTTAGDKDVALDLTACMVPGEIMIPEGTAIVRRVHGTAVLQYGSEFAIEIEKEKEPLAKTKAEWDKSAVSWVTNTATLLVAEIKMELNTGPLHGFVFAQRVELGGQVFHLHTPIYTAFTKAQVERMVRSAATIKQTDAIREVLKKEPAAIARLEKAGCLVETLSNERRLFIRDKKVTDDDLAVIGDITGVTEIAVVNTGALTAAGTAHLAEARYLRNLSLTGAAITDQLVAPLARCSGVETLNIQQHALTDAGLAFLAGMPNLQSFGMDNTFDAPVPPRITGTGFVHLNKATGLRKVKIHGGPVGDVACEYLAANKALTELSFEQTRITDASGKHLREMTALTRLNLPGNPIGDAGLAQLDTLTKLEGLNLDGTRLKSQGLAAISSLPQLKWLSLQHTPVTDGGVDRLHGSTLVTLDLSFTSVSDRCCSAFPDIAGLRELKLLGTKVTDAGLVHLGRVKNLESLDLSSTGVTGSGLSQFKGRPALQAIQLMGTPVTDASLSELAGCPNLSGLNLDCTGITDAGLERLRDVKKLRGVSLNAADVTAAGVARFQKDHPKILITWDELKDEPEPKLVAAPIPVEKLPTADPAALVKKYGGQTKTDDEADGKPVVEVDLSGKDVTDEELGQLRAWKQLRKLDLSGCKKVTDAGLHYLGLLTNLTTLNLQYTGVRGDGLVHLKGLTNLAILELPNETMSLKQVAPLAALKELQRFEVKLSESGYGALRFLGGFPRLKAVSLPIQWQNDRHLALIQNMVGLESLAIKSDHVSERGLAYLKGLKNLRELYLNSELATDDGLKHVGALTGLKTLTLSGHRFTDLGFQNLRGLEGLERLKVEGTSLTDRGLSHIREFGKLIELELPRADVGDLGMTHLAEMKDLEFIDLSGTRVTDEGLKNFKGMEELRKLMIEDSKITGRGFAAIKKLPRLARLHLAHSPIDDEGLAAIAQVQALEELELTDSTITDAGLAKLKALPTLHDLKLNGVTRLTDKAVDVLKEFPVLTSVDVRGSGISPKGIAELRKKEGLSVTPN